MTLSVSRHRRSRRSGWIAAAVGVTLVAVGGAVIALLPRAGDGGCAEPDTLRVVVSPDQLPAMTRLAEQWNAGDAAGDGCTSIAVDGLAPSTVAAAVAPGWDEATYGPPPDVWVPDSSVWLTVAAARPDAAGILPAGASPSLASSPVVFAMQRPMAEAMGWPEQPLGWSDLLGAFGRGETWEQFGYPEWGPLQLGMPDPTLTTAGLGGVMTLLDLDNDSAMSDQEMLGGIAFSQLVTAPAEDTEALLDSYAGADGEAQQHPAGFPVLERDLAAHLADASGLPLVPVYMKEGLVFADYPYAVLRAPWVDEGRQELAGQFLEFVQGEAGRQAYAEEGFRDPAHAAAGSALLSPDRGFLTEVPVPSREPSAEGLDELLGFWPLLARPTNILIVVDTSGSMNDAVPETDLSRLQLLKAAAIEGLGLLNNQTTMGLWEFSSGLTPTTPYQELIPLGPADEDVGEAPRRQAMTAAIQQLDADGGTGLYDTIHDAYQVMREAYQPGAQNMLVVITDGRDEFHDGRSLPELLAAVEEAVQPDQPLPVIALAVGPEADAQSLEQVIELTGGRTIIARDQEETIQQVVLAFAGRIS